MILSLVITAMALAMMVWLPIRLKRQVRREQQLRQEAEESKQQALREQERNRQLKQEMTNNIAHELKTPVSSIRGFLEILLGDRPVTEAQRRDFLERCYRQTLRLSDLINDVSLINKLEEANDLFVRETVNLRRSAEEAILELKPHAAAQHITIHDQLPENLDTQGNGLLMYSIFRNLIENAIMHAGEGVEVTLRCYKPADETHYYISLSDTGCGVDNEYLPRLFDRFLRIDKGRSRKNGGTGLGLSIVKHAVLFHGGNIYAKNRDGGGLELFFSIEKKK